MQHDPFLARIIPAFTEVPGVAAVALGGSRARGTAHDASDYDIGLYFSAGQPLDTDRLLLVAKTLVDDPDAAAVTPVGEWGPWIVGGAWLSIAGQKVDLLYRCAVSAWTTSRDIPTDFARRYGWERLPSVSRFTIRGRRSPA